MSEADVVHRVALELMDPVPPVDAAAGFAVRVAINADGCELAGAPFEVHNEQGALVTSGVLPEIRAITPESDEYDPRHGRVDTRPHASVELTAPSEIGEFDWTLVLPAGEVNGVAYAAAQVPIHFVTGIHTLSVTAWDVTTPVTAGDEISFKVGVKCSARCRLAGQRVEAHNQRGTLVARAALSNSTWPSSDALYWAPMKAKAPKKIGQHRWTVTFPGADGDLPHTEVRPAAFTFMTTPQPEHKVTVRVVFSDGQVPVEDVLVRLGPYRAATDKDGLAGFAVPKGEFRLFAWKTRHKIPERMVEVAGDRRVSLEAELLPEEDPYAMWKG